MNIQEAIKSGKPFRRRGWGDGHIYIVQQLNVTVLTIESSPDISIELEVQDILADDWYTRDDLHEAYALQNQLFHQALRLQGRESAE
ncbi:MAG TPA: hypothetical protein VFR47_17810 [Anaerolineales bacterium]|nr:hypothetical protein [Anaerolineales bacterium]